MWQSHLSDAKRYRTQPTSPPRSLYNIQYKPEQNDDRMSASEFPLPRSPSLKSQYSTSTPPMTPTLTMSSTSSKRSERDMNTQNPESDDEEVGSVAVAAVFVRLKEGTTPSIKNIRAAYSRAGGTKTNTPGTPSKLGSLDDGPGKIQGLESEEFENRIQDQRSESSAIGRAFDKLLNGSRHVSRKNSHD